MSDKWKETNEVGQRLKESSKKISLLITKEGKEMWSLRAYF